MLNKTLSLKRTKMAVAAVSVGAAAFSATPALAEETTQTINGTMAVKLQAGPAQTAIDTIASTGDALWLLAASLVLLAVGALFLFRASREFAGAATAHTALGGYAGAAQSRKKLLVAAVVAALLACSCLGAFVNRQASIAAEILSQTSSTIVVDSSGVVVDNSLAIQNNGAYAVTIESVQAPVELSNWTASLAGSSIEAAKSASGTWNGGKISADLLSRLKNGSGEVQLSYSVTLTCDDGQLPCLDFDAFTVDTSMQTYQASQITPQVEAEGYVEGVDYTVGYGENTDAGLRVGTITVKGIGDYSGEKIYTFSIAPKTITVTGTKALEKEYDGTQDVEFDDSDNVIDGLCEGDEITAEAYGELDAVEAGDRTATIKGYYLSGDNAANYQLATATPSLTVPAKVTPAVCEVEWYNTEFTYDQQSHAPVASVVNTCDGEVLVVTVEGAQTNAGTYTATAVAVDDANYTLEGATGVTQSFTITPAIVTASGISADDKVYDGTTDATLNFDAMQLSGALEGDAVSIDKTSAKGTFASKDAGNAVRVSISGLALSGSSAGNYTFASDGRQQVTNANITKKTVGLEWGSTTSLVYSAAEQYPEVRVTGVLDGDTVNAEVESAQAGVVPMNVGDYTAEVVGLDNDNYEIDSSAALTQAYKIMQKSVKASGITARNKVYDGNNDATIDYDQAVVEGVCAGDKLTVTGGMGLFENNSKGTNIQVNLPTYYLAGDTATVANYVLADDTQRTTTANITEGELDANAFTCQAPDEEYKGSKYEPLVVCTGDYVLNEDYRIVYGGNTNVDDACYAAVVGMGNYAGYISFPFQITAKTIDVTWGDLVFYYDNDYHKPAATAVASQLIGSDTAEIEVSGSAIAAGTHTATAASKNKNYVVSDSTKSMEFDIEESKSVEVLFNNNGHGTSSTTPTAVKTGDKLDYQECGEAAGLKLEGWYKNQNCSDDSKWNFDTDVVTGDLTLYANWVPDTDAEVYWIAPASKITTGNNDDTVDVANKDYVREEWNVEKSSAEIKADIAVLLEGESNENYASVKAEYEAYMNNDNFHLYTKWNGSTADASGEQASNGYVEFRIIEVGAHDGGEALTLQATHALPAGYAMANGSSPSNAGGWVSSDLKAALSEGGDIYSNFNTAFTSDIATVAKKSNVGSASTKAGVSSNTFWIASLEELAGFGTSPYSVEGAQYTYFKNLGIETSQADANKALARSTRAGNDPANVEASDGTHGRTWTRSAFTTNSTDYYTVNGSGYIGENFSNYSTVKEGVVLSFAFGSSSGTIVTFDTQNHGNINMAAQVVDSGAIATEPTVADYGTSTGLKLEGWYTNKNCKAATKWDFSTPVASDITLYANWVVDAEASEGNSYWIASSWKTATTLSSYEKANKNYVSETTNVLKSQVEIEADVAKIKAGDAATIAEYTQIMNSDAYHLYSNWKGGTATNEGKYNAHLKYIECRILEVGEHNGDGTALTFQTTHLLQDGYLMMPGVEDPNDEGSILSWDRWPVNNGGWGESTLRTYVNYDASGNAGEILKKFDAGLVSDIVPVTKAYTIGGKNTATKTTTDVLWNLAWVEISNTTASGYADEGTQYTYYKNLMSAQTANSSKALSKKTRASKSLPWGGDENYCSGQWWLRSASTSDSTNFLVIASSGNMACFSSMYEIGVAPCFAF